MSQYCICLKMIVMSLYMKHNVIVEDPVVDHNLIREYSGSVVECMTGDRGAVGSSLTGITVLCP